jgi:hypothetical protein
VRFYRRAIFENGLILAVFAAAVAVIQPRGNFPILDDWDFAIATWRFAQTGHFHFTNFTAVSLRAMVLWGAAWTRLFGESFNVLRASTLTLSFGTLCVFNRTLKLAAIPTSLRIVSTLALLFHPLYLWLSCTYMTDVPYLFASSIAIYAFVVALRDGRFGWLFVACLAVMTAWFIRQNGVMLLLPPLMLLAFYRERITPRWRSFAVAICAFLALFAILLFFRREWLAGSPAMFATHYHMWQEATFRLEDQVATLDHYVIFNVQNTAFFFLPLVLPLLILLRPLSRRAAIVLGILTLIIGWRVGSLAYHGRLVPYHAAHLDSDILPGNLFVDFGLGPAMLDGATDFQPGFSAPRALLAALTILSAVVAIVLVWALLCRPAPTLLFKLTVLAATVCTLALFASGLYYDRYSLDSAWMVSLALPLIIPWERRSARWLAGVALAVVAAFSVLSVQEHFTWQRARWQAWTDLRTRGVAVTQIDGGGEAFGLYELADAPVAVGRRGHPPRAYAIALHSLPGYRVVGEYPFTSFLGMRHGAIVALQRI